MCGTKALVLQCGVNVSRFCVLFCVEKKKGHEERKLQKHRTYGTVVFLQKNPASGKEGSEKEGKEQYHQSTKWFSSLHITAC